MQRATRLSAAAARGGCLPRPRSEGAGRRPRPSRARSLPRRAPSSERGPARGRWAWHAEYTPTLAGLSVISFARGVPAPECLPVAELADCAKAALERDGRVALSYGSTLGYEPLREWIAERHGVEPRRVLLTNGSLEGFVFLATHLLAAGPRRVALEAPTYDR